MFKRRIEPDLFLINLLTLLLILLIATSFLSWLRILLGFPFILFFPGYVLTAVLFPAKTAINNSTRLALSIGLSIVAVTLIGLALSYSPWHIKLSSLLASVSIFVLVLSSLAWYLRGRATSSDRFHVDLRSPLSDVTTAWTTSGHSYRFLVVIFACAIVIGTGSLSFVLANPDTESQPYTELYILGKNGQATNYPRDLTIGEESTIILGIVNRENTEIEYDLRISFNGNPIQAPSLIRLEPNEKWEQPISFTPQRTGTRQQLKFVLCNDIGTPCEERVIKIDVRAPST